MPSRSGRAALLAVLIVAGCCLMPGAARASTTTAGTITADVSATPFSQPLPSGFLGFSFEYSALHAYTGRDPLAINPMLLALIKLLNANQAPIIRIGGNSTDDTWWPTPGVVPSGGVNYTLTKGFMRTAQAFAADLGAKLIMGVNLEANSPALAATEARAIVQGVGARNIAALEIGNEADLYGLYPWYINRLHQSFFGRLSTWDMPSFITQFSQWRQLLPAGIPVAGPTFSSLDWMADLPQFLSAEPGLGYVTFHRYALRACETDPTASDFASIPNLLADRSSEGLAEEIQPYVNDAHQSGIKFRLDELNSAACTGRLGVSNTFASSLWMLDTLFSMAAVGADGVNIHTLPKAPYAPFSFRESASGVWSADVHPSYYGMLMFAQADPPGSRLLNVNVPDGPVKVWAVQTPDGHTNLVIINKDVFNAYNVHVNLAGAQTPLTGEQLTAPSIGSTSDVAIGGQQFPANATTLATIGDKVTETVTAGSLGYDITAPAASAIVLSR